MRTPKLFALLVVTAALLGLAACGEDDGAPTQDDQGSADVPLAPVHVQGPDLEWWRRRPALSLFFMGGQKGTLKPCGCSEPQKGGLARAASVYQQLRKRAENAEGAVAGLSLGWSMQGRGELQEEVKADLLRAVNETLGVSALLLGATDIPVDAMCQPRGEVGADLPHPPVNVRLSAVNPAVDATPLVDLTVRDLKIRALSVLEPDVAEMLQSGGYVDGIVSISRAFEALSPRPDTLWIVAADIQNDATLETLAAAVRRLGATIIVDVTGGSGDTSVDHATVEPGGKPLVVGLDELGKAVGVLDVERHADPGWVVSYRRIELVPQWEKYGGPLPTEVQDLEALYRTMVRERGLLEAALRVQDQGPSFVGSNKCAPCHQAVYVDWMKTSHAHALQTLEEKDYHWDPECIRCHVVGWLRSVNDWVVTESGFRTPEGPGATRHLGGVGCESCHGPGSEHVDAPWDDALFAEGGPNVAKPGKRVCQTCHDVENSHGFQEGYETEFLPQVDHRLVPSDRLVNDPPDDD